MNIRSIAFFKYVIFSGDHPCGYFCLNTDNYFHIPDFNFNGFFGFDFKVCDGKNDCLNTDLDERFCDGSYNSDMCNLVCASDSVNCEDESFCNGYSYGVWCKSGEYLPSYILCRKINECLEKPDYIH